MTDTERRRRRPAVSCTLCRKRKIRCNRENPCNNCVRLKQEHCVYDNDAVQSKAQQPERDHVVELRPAHRSPSQLSQGERSTSATPSERSKSVAGSSTAVSTPTSHPVYSETEFMKKRIRQLEGQLYRTEMSAERVPSLGPNLETSLGAGAFILPKESNLFGRAQTVSRSVMHKTRLFGQSHWINGAVLFWDMMQTMEPYVKRSSSEALSDVQKCKSLARVIKSHRTPAWPLLVNTELPQKDVADLLVKCYFDTIEPIHRVLHGPSFRTKYEALWSTDQEADKSFLVQVKLVLAIGAASYDESFSLRVSAIQWVYEAQSWYSEPDFKSKLNIQSLQNQILLLLARELVDVGGTMVWISMGSLLRTAMYIGLHRDPTRLPERSGLAVEVRRRLWNTILEMTVQSSLSAGGPPLISLEDFDTEPPGNFNDEDLTAETLVESPPTTFTSTSISIALRKTFPLRLAITKFLNDTTAINTYQETLHLDAGLRASYKALRQSFQEYKNGSTPSRFELENVDFLIHRYLLSLHLPFLAASFHDSTCAWSRKVTVDIALKIWCTLYPNSSIGVIYTQSDSSSSATDYLGRLALRGSSSFRITAFQASLVIASEVKSKLQEEDNLGPVLLRNDLLSLLEDVKTWAFRCIEVGETNMKGYLLICLMTSYIEGLKQQLTKDKLGEFLSQAAAEAGKRCVEVLSKLAAPIETQRPLDEHFGPNFEVPPEPVEDWDLMMTDSPFNLSNTELLNWVLNGDATEVASLW